MVTIWNTRRLVSLEHVLNKHLPEGRMKSTVSSTAGPQKGEGRGREGSASAVNGGTSEGFSCHSRFTTRLHCSILWSISSYMEGGQSVDRVN